MLDKIGLPDISPTAAPPVAYHFMVLFYGVGPLPVPNPLDMRFQRVSGMGMTIPSGQKSNKGGESFSLPQWPQYDNLVLERGFVVGISPLKKELELALESLQFQPKDIHVMLLNEMGLPVVSWLFFGAYPARWSIGDLDATQSSLLIETIEFTYKRFQSISL